MEQKMDCRRAFAQTLLELAEKDPAIYVLTSDARGSALLGDFAAALPDRLVEAGIAEQDEVGVAAGMALSGKTVFVCAPAPFLSARSFEQVKLDAAYNQANVKIIGVSGGVSYGTLGASHHALQDLAAMRAVAELTVLVPSDGIQMRALTRWMAQTKGPVYLRMGRGEVPVLYDPADAFTVGKAKLLRPGEDITLIAAGEMAAPALAAAHILETQGIAARVLDMFTVKPLDREAIRCAAQETGCILTVEEHSVCGGLGGAVAETVVQTCPVPMTLMGLPDEHIYAGESPDVFAHYGLTAQGIAEKARMLFLKRARR